MQAIAMVRNKVATVAFVPNTHVDPKDGTVLDLGLCLARGRLTYPVFNVQDVVDRVDFSAENLDVITYFNPEFVPEISVVIKKIGEATLSKWISVYLSAPRLVSLYRAELVQR